MQNTSAMPLEKDPSRLKRRAFIAAWACRLTALASLIGIGYMWIDQGFFSSMLKEKVGHGNIVTLTPASELAALVIASIPGALFAWIMLRLAALFARIEEGQVMSLHNVRSLSQTGWLLILYALIGSVSHTLIVLAATIANPPGQRMLSITFQTSHMSGLAAGAAFLAFALVMREAVRLWEENESFV